MSFKESPLRGGAGTVATVLIHLSCCCALALGLSSDPPLNSTGNSPSTYQPTATSAPNYLETGRQITGILDRFMSLGYDKRVRPNYGGPPVEVNVTMRILSISSVSEVMMDFTADFYFRQTWHDPRLSFKKLGDIQRLYVGAEVSKKIWLPDTFFGNEKLAYFHEATTPNVFLRIDHSGEVYRSIRLTVTSSCPMNLQYFPMDRQRCTIEAESYGYNVKDIIYKWAHKKAVETDNQISLPQFDIKGTEQKYRLEELSSGTYSRLIAEILFARRMGYYLIQIYIPSSLIVVISWVSFWLHRNASPARVQLGVTTVLTMTTLMSSTNAALPKISYIKSIDIFLGTCFIMVFAALLEYATVGYLGKRIAMRKAHLQHAQSQAQARIFAQLQSQGAQGESVPPLPSSVSTQEQVAASLMQAGSTGLLAQPSSSDYFQTAPEPTPPVPPERFRPTWSQTNTNHKCSCSCGATSGCGSYQPSCCEQSCTLPRSFATLQAPQAGQCRHKQHQQHRHHYDSHRDCHRSSQHLHQCSSGDLHDHAAQQDSHQRYQHHCHQHHHRQYQPPTYTCKHHVAAELSPGAKISSHGAAAAAAAAATFVNMHRRQKGLPPSNNPNFSQFSWLNSPQSRALETIFGIRPSDIDKYSRVVFPVCFVCFQLMYWIVYLHISAFLETEQQPAPPS